MRMRIPYDDLPNTSRLIALCQVKLCCFYTSTTACLPARCAQLLTPFTVLQDIYIARAEGELALEEELYWCAAAAAAADAADGSAANAVTNITEWPCNLDCCRALISVYRQPNIMFELTKKND